MIHMTSMNYYNYINIVWGNNERLSLFIYLFENEKYNGDHYGAYCYDDNG